MALAPPQPNIPGRGAEAFTSPAFVNCAESFGAKGCPRVPAGSPEPALESQLVPLPRNC